MLHSVNFVSALELVLRIMFLVHSSVGLALALYSG